MIMSFSPIELIIDGIKLIIPISLIAMIAALLFLGITGVSDSIESVHSAFTSINHKSTQKLQTEGASYIDNMDIKEINGSTAFSITDPNDWGTTDPVPTITPNTF